MAALRVLGNALGTAPLVPSEPGRVASGPPNENGTRMVWWVPLLACPAVFVENALLDKPAVAPKKQPLFIAGRTKHLKNFGSDAHMSAPRFDSLMADLS